MATKKATQSAALKKALKLAEKAKATAKRRKAAKKGQLTKALKEDVKKVSSWKIGKGQNYPQSNVWTEKADKEVVAKPVGYRWTDEGAKKVGKSANSRPTASDVEKYTGKTFRIPRKPNPTSEDGSYRYIYQEKRVDKSDISQKKKFEEGGETLAKGGETHEMAHGGQSSEMAHGGETHEMAHGGDTHKPVVYKGVKIAKLHPSGYFEYYSDAQERFLKFSDLDDAKREIDREMTMGDAYNDYMYNRAFKKGGYNTGLSWKLDRARHNKSERWEKPFSERKSKYAKGGGLEKEIKKDLDKLYKEDREEERKAKPYLTQLEQLFKADVVANILSV